jgi:hypothetical protein
MLQRVGVSFRSPLSPSDVRQEVIAPLRAAVESSAAGIYSNYMHQADASPEARDAEHLIVFEVQDFKEGLRVLRVAAQGLPLAVAWQFHNLNPSQPLY